MFCLSDSRLCPMHVARTQRVTTTCGQLTANRRGRARVAQWLAAIRQATHSSLRRRWARLLWRLECVAWRIVASHCAVLLWFYWLLTLRIWVIILPTCIRWSRKGSIAKSDIIITCHNAELSLFMNWWTRVTYCDNIGYPMPTFTALKNI